MMTGARHSGAQPARRALGRTVTHPSLRAWIRVGRDLRGGWVMGGPRRAPTRRVRAYFTSMSSMYQPARLDGLVSYGWNSKRTWTCRLT